MGETPFFHACRDGQLECVRVLVGIEGVDLVKPHNDGTAPIEKARKNGHTAIVDFLEPVLAAGHTKGGEAALAAAGGSSGAGGAGRK